MSHQVHKRYHDRVHTIVTKGSGILVFNKDGTINKPERAKFNIREGVLTLEMEGSAISFNSGVDGTISSVSFGSGSSIHIDGTGINVSDSGNGWRGYVYINGQRVGLDKIAYDGEEEKDVDDGFEDTKDIQITPGGIEQIKRTGSMSVELPGKFIHNEKFVTTVRGSGNLTLTGSTTCMDVESSISGSGDFTVHDLHAEDASISIQGSGDVIINGGITKDLNINIAGSGDVKWGSVVTKRATVNIAGSGDARVTAINGAKFRKYVTGSGSARCIRVFGIPVKVPF